MKRKTYKPRPSTQQKLPLVLRLWALITFPFKKFPWPIRLAIDIALLAGIIYLIMTFIVPFATGLLILALPLIFMGAFAKDLWKSKDTTYTMTGMTQQEYDDLNDPRNDT